MPEEINRTIIDHNSDLLFVPTVLQKQNLLREGISKKKIFIVGNTIADSIKYFKINKINLKYKDYILVTFHRHELLENFKRLKKVINLINKIAYQTRLTIIFPIHPRTKKQILKLFGKSFLEEELRDFLLFPPVSFLDTIMLISNADIIITDSGGIQKEAYFFNKKSLILRGETEWIEIIDEKAAILVGAEKERIIDGYTKIKTLKPSFKPIFGDGMAGSFICKTILNEIT